MIGEHLAATHNYDSLSKNCQSHRLLTINKAPPITYRNTQTVKSLRRHNSGHLLETKATYKGLPITLPKINDFWKGNRIGKTQYGDSVTY